MSTPITDPEPTIDRPSLETLAGLYGASLEQRERADRFHAHVVSLALRYGYTETDVQHACAHAIPEKRTDLKK